VAHDPVAALLRLRGIERDAARAALAEAIGVEDAARAALRAAEEGIAAEEAMASELDADDLRVEAFAAWFRRASAARAEARTHAARSVLAAGVAALRSVEIWAQRRDAAAARAVLRAEQRVLDDRVVDSRHSHLP
jgi:hypothetical protein